MTPGSAHPEIRAYRDVRPENFLMGSLFFPGNREIFQKKQGGDLSTNAQSLRGIRDLDNFSKSK
jgi:hypothetical protein